MNFEFWINGKLSKMGLHFSNKVIQNLILSKNINNKKCAHKLVFFNKVNWERFRWFLIYVESQILAFFDSSPLVQNSKFNHFLWVCWFLGKNLSHFVSSIWELHNPSPYLVWLDIACSQPRWASFHQMNLIWFISWMVIIDGNMKLFY